MVLPKILVLTARTSAIAAAWDPKGVNCTYITSARPKRNLHFESCLMSRKFASGTAVFVGQYLTPALQPGGRWRSTNAGLCIWWSDGRPVSFALYQDHHMLSHLIELRLALISYQDYHMLLP